MNEQLKSSDNKAPKADHRALNMHWGNEAFQKNFLEICTNPSSNYCGKIQLFSELLGLEQSKIGLEAKISEATKKANELEKKIAELEREKKSLETNIHGDEECPGMAAEVKLLKEQLASLEQEKTKQDQELQKKWALVEEEIKKAEDNLAEKRASIAGEIKKAEDKLKQKKCEVMSGIEKEEKKFHTAKNMADIKRENRSQLWFFYSITGCITLGLIIASLLALCNSADVIASYVAHSDKLDYFGLFLLKVPYSILLLGFIYGAIVLITKLLVLVKKIHDQQRDISQILAIAQTISNATAITFCSPGDAGYNEELEEQSSKDLHYKLIAQYLGRIGSEKMGDGDIPKSLSEAITKAIAEAVSQIPKTLQSISHK